LCDFREVTGFGALPVLDNGGSRKLTIIETEFAMNILTKPDKYSRDI